MSNRATSVSGELEDREESEHGSEEGGSVVSYSGCVYHLGVNSIGHEYCHLRFLLLRGSHVAMYKRDPHRNPGIKPIRKGVISHTLMVEDIGRRTINQGDVYVLRFYNRLDETKKGEIACASAGEARKWMEAFDQAKQKAVYELLKRGSRYMLDTDNELNLEGHRPRVRRYAHGLKKFIKIGRGPEVLLRKSSNLAGDARTEAYSEEMVGDAIEAHTWKCVRTVNGIRIFEDIAHPKAGKTFLVKAVGVIDASVDTVFETVLSIDRKKRYEWDMITGDLEFVDTIDGHYDVVYGTHEPQRLSWWQSKTDFVFSRQWFRGQDEAYTILQSPAVHRKRPPRSSYQRIKINPSTWEIRRLSTSKLGTAKCLVTQMLEIQCSFWDRWKIAHCLEFERTSPYALLCQVAGLKEYFESNSSLILDSPSEIVLSNVADSSGVNSELEDTDVEEEFYDAIANDGSQEDEESDDDEDDNFNFENSKSEKVKLKNVSWAITSLALKRRTASSENGELDCSSSPVTVDLEQFNGSLHKEKDESDTNCWAAPGGQGFMIRGKTYLSDYSKVMGGNPLLKLIAVDWLKAGNVINQVALHPKCIVQSEAGKKLPFILVINLQVPAKPNYSLVLYYAAQRPVKKDSLLGRFANESDVFRDARFKLIPSIVEGYWMVKRAVGTKACLLGKAVTCRYLRQDNFLEIDVDIGSSSVARSIINLVLGYVTSLVVDLAILIEVILHKKTVFDMWKKLEQMYGHKHDMLRTYHLSSQIFELEQGSMSVTNYFAALKGVWDEFDYFRMEKWTSTDDIIHEGREVGLYYYELRMTSALERQHSVWREKNQKFYLWPRIAVSVSVKRFRFRLQQCWVVS